MSSPYRAGPTPGDPDEPMPQFRPKPHDVAHLMGIAAVILTAAWICHHYGDDAGATKLLVVWVPALLMATLILVSERFVRAWLARRHARVVARGVEQLEAKVSRLDNRR